MQKGEFFVTGEVFLLDIGLLMGAKVYGCLLLNLSYVTFGSVNFLGFLVGGVQYG